MPVSSADNTCMLYLTLKTFIILDDLFELISKKCFPSIILNLKTKSPKLYELSQKACLYIGLCWLKYDC